jgi:hypothetical protein
MSAENISISLQPNGYYSIDQKKFPFARIAKSIRISIATEATYQSKITTRVSCILQIQTKYNYGKITKNEIPEF